MPGPCAAWRAAAERVRTGSGGRAAIPDFSNRRDEIGELSAALRDMTAALYSRLDAIEGFAADVAHEIRNPLTSLRSAVEALDNAKAPEQRRKLFAILRDDVDRVDRLITDIADASRPRTAELSRSAKTRVDMAALLATPGRGAQRDGAGRISRPDAQCGSRRRRPRDPRH